MGTRFVACEGLNCLQPHFKCQLWLQNCCFTIVNVPRNRQRAHLARALVLLLVAGCWFAASRVGAEATESSLTTNAARATVSDSVAIDMEVAAFGNAITNQLKAIG